jgi:redox-sensitive bicupin YhaK (pirin superfamily)
MAGEPIDAPAYSNGPFVLSSAEAIHDAVARYRSGAMGSLPPGW